MWPQSLRNRLILLMVIVVALPILVSGYLMTISAETALVEEKQNKLFGAAKMLDNHLVGTFDDILVKYGVQNADKPAKVAVLNKELQPFTDQVADVYPGIGVGYYVKDLDIQATYGPSRLYANQVGLSIGPGHEGHLVMQTGEPRVQVGNLMRGNIMNAMHPLIRNGQIIGYIYANELTADIEAQTGSMKRHMIVIMILGLLIGIAGAVFLVDSLVLDVKRIENGLERLKTDLTFRIPVMQGEIGKISLAINNMAEDLVKKSLLEEQVARFERLFLAGEVAAGIAHEIRNPLMAIRGFTQLMREELSHRKRQEFIDVIERETERMDRLTEQLLRIARPMEHETGAVDVNEVLSSTLMLVNSKAMMEDIRITCNLSNNLPLVMANDEQLRQVFLNILLNAIQAITAKPGRIYVNTLYEAEKNRVIVEVSDTGPGIAPEVIDKVFDPFFSTKPDGTGLGLAVAYRLVEEWQGKILAKSEPGHGATFSVLLPALEVREGGDQQKSADCR